MTPLCSVQIKFMQIACAQRSVRESRPDLSGCYSQFRAGMLLNRGTLLPLNEDHNKESIKGMIRSFWLDFHDYDNCQRSIVKPYMELAEIYLHGENVSIECYYCNIKGSQSELDALLDEYTRLSVDASCRSSKVGIKVPENGRNNRRITAR